MAFKWVPLFCFGLIMMSCTTPPSPPVRIKSGIDADYRFNRWKQKENFNKSPSILFYQKVLSQTLGSNCSLFPHDSAYSQVHHQQCSTGVAVLKSMSRFYLESDAAVLGLPIIEKKGVLLREDFPKNCTLF